MKWLTPALSFAKRKTESGRRKELMVVRCPGKKILLSDDYFNGG